MPNRFVHFLLLASLCAAAPGLRAQESGSFRLERLTPASVAVRAASASFVDQVIAAQSAVVGAASACNTGAVTALGLLSIEGTGDVPVRLDLGRETADPDTTLLFWSGLADTFAVHRSSVRNDVGEAANLRLLTMSCEASDVVEVLPGDIVFYLVLNGSTP